MNIVKVYCDGACSGNHKKINKGGWGAVLLYRGKQKQIYGGEKNTTNQRMEIVACIKALEALKTNKIPVEIYSDSAYLVNCIKQKWYEKWLKNGWKNSKKEPVLNQDLWMRLIDLLKMHTVYFIKVSGHSGVALNELADELAKRGVGEMS